LALGLALGVSSPQNPPPAPPVDRPFRQLLPNLVTDFRSLPSRDTALIAAAGTAATFALKPADDHISENGQEEEHSQYAELGSWLGSGWVQAGAAIATYTVGVSLKHTPSRHIGSDLIRAQLANGLLTRVLKVAVDRERPDGGGHSFPSGHASATFATAGVLGAHFGWRVAIPAYAIAGFVGWARVRDDQHWATDVAAGATIGAIIGHSVARTHDSRWTVVPAVSQTSQGILVVRR
jgi:membrane-associated phospholipid phosphatase